MFEILIGVVVVVVVLALIVAAADPEGVKRAREEQEKKREQRKVLKKSATDAQGRVVCPACKSDQLSAQKRGFNVKKGVAGALVTGGIGLAAGLHGRRKIVLTCLGCGHSWKAG